MYAIVKILEAWTNIDSNRIVDFEIVEFKYCWSKFVENYRDRVDFAFDFWTILFEIVAFSKKAQKILRFTTKIVRYCLRQNSIL